MEELKPCPFCGEKPEKWFYFESEHFYVSITCRKCNISKMESVYLDDGHSYVNPSGKFIWAEENAVKKWNQRNGK